MSGGLDSATTLAIARRDGFACAALTFDYGQRHSLELDAARRVVASLGAERHIVFPIDLRAFGGSALTDDLEVPKGGSSEEEIPPTYVPARNTVFLSIALAWAEVLRAKDIFIGANAVDYSGYPDCRPEFIEAFQGLANVATKAGVEGDRFSIHAPLISLAKVEIIRTGLELNVDYSMTHSCYDPPPEGRPCGQCDSCLIRSKAFAELGMEDPVLSYA